MQPGWYFAEWWIKHHQQELLREADDNRRRQSLPFSLRRRVFRVFGRLLMRWGATLDRRSPTPSADGAARS